MILEELNRNPFESIRSAARLTILSGMPLDEKTPVLLEADLDAALSRSRDELVAVVAAWLPGLAALRDRASFETWRSSLH